MRGALQLRSVPILCVVAGCASPAGGPVIRSEGMRRLEPTAASNSVADGRRNDSVVIGKLRFRDAELVVHADQVAGAGIRFGVLDRNGNVLREALTEVDLSTHFPELHQAYRKSLAEDQPSLDARVDDRHYERSLLLSQQRMLGDWFDQRCSRRP